MKAKIIFLGILVITSGCTTIKETDFIAFSDVQPARHTMGPNGHSRKFIILGNGNVQLRLNESRKGIRHKKIKSKLTKKATQSFFQECIDAGVMQINNKIYQRLDSTPEPPTDLFAKLNPPESWGFPNGIHISWWIFNKGSSKHFPLVNRKAPLGNQRMSGIVSKYTKAIIDGDPNILDIVSLQTPQQDITEGYLIYFHSNFEPKFSFYINKNGEINYSKGNKRLHRKITGKEKQIIQKLINNLIVNGLFSVRSFEKYNIDYVLKVDIGQYNNELKINKKNKDFSEFYKPLIKLFLPLIDQLNKELENKEDIIKIR